MYNAWWWKDCQPTTAIKISVIIIRRRDLELQLIYRIGMEKPRRWYIVCIWIYIYIHHSHITEVINESKLIQYATGGQPTPKRRYGMIETRTTVALEGLLHESQWWNIMMLLLNCFTYNSEDMNSSIINSQSETWSELGPIQ